MREIDKKGGLNDVMVELCPLRTDHDEIIVEASSMGVWMEWPPSDLDICDFEIEQWLNACDMVLAAFCLLCASAPTFKQNTLQTAIVAKTNK